VVAGIGIDTDTGIISEAENEEDINKPLFPVMVFIHGRWIKYFVIVYYIVCTDRRFSIEESLCCWNYM
jgi:hypothetical protein